MHNKRFFYLVNINTFTLTPKQDDFTLAARENDLSSFLLADIFQIEVSSVDLFYIYLCDFAKRCPLSFRVLLDVSREPGPEPIRGWVASLFCVKNQGGREGRFCHLD